MSRYAIWNKKSDVITPIGEVLTAEEWKERYPVAKVDSIEIVCGGGDINGAYFGILSTMVEMYKKAGCDFSSCKTSQDKLDAIEEFEDSRNADEETTVSTDERIAAALEAQVLMAMDNMEG